MINTDNLDKRICDVEEQSINAQTYRQYITDSENQFGMEHEDLDLMCNYELKEHLAFMDYLWTK